MTRKFRVIASVAFAFAAVSCSGELASSEVLASAKDSYELSSDTNLSKDVSSETEPTESSSEEESSSTPVELNWPTDEINGYAELYFFCTDGIPTPSYGLDEGRVYEVELTEYFDYTVGYYYYVWVTASGDFSTYGDDLVASGWECIPDAYGETATIYTSPDTNLGIAIYPYDEIEDLTELYIALNPGYYSSWPSLMVDQALEILLGTDEFVSMPALSGGSYYLISGYALYSPNLGYETVYAGVGNFVDEFDAILEEAGYSLETIDYQSVYVYPDRLYGVRVSDYSLLERTTVRISAL